MNTSTPSRQDYHALFQDELDRLNEAQRRAVEQIEGPVLVIAGPGTGKTHILSARIGRILLETDTNPHNILCLTFTDAGVQAMRERLLQFIGPTAHRVHIYTFHSFCNTIIQDNLELFGRHQLEPASELEQIELLQNMLDELDARHPLKRGRKDGYFYIDHLRNLFQQMKREDWSVEFVQQQVDAYLESLPERPEFVYQISRGDFKKGDLKTAKVKDITTRMRRLQAAAELYPHYLERMQAMQRYDYDDMILWVLRAFEENEALLRTYQEQYLYFLIDEFQDTNGAQNEVIQKLIDYWQVPNIFIVGDDDQSIYEFQGARLRNLREFYQQHATNLKLVVLKNNYRSSQHILDSAAGVIQHNEHRIINDLQELGITKLLKAQAELPAIVRPEIVAYPNRLQEDADIVHQIEQLKKDGFLLEEVAIIYARHRQASNLITLLEKKGIPYTTKRQVNILDLPVIQNLRRLLQYLAAEHARPYSGEYLLFRVMHADFLGIDTQDLATVSLHLANFPRMEQPQWRNFIADAKQLDALSLKNPQALVEFATLMNRLIADIANYPVPILLERILNRSGLLRHVLQHEEKNWLLQVVKTFFDFVKKESDRNPRLTIRRLLDILNSMDNHRIRLNVNREDVSENGVNLVTAHSSKGLEFRHVYLLDCVQNDWEPRSRGSTRRFKLPDTLTYSGEEDALEARRRLFYVGMTRAKERLHISYSQEDEKGKALQRAIFVEELLAKSELDVQSRAISAEAVLEAQFWLLAEKESPTVDRSEKAVIDQLLQHFKLSISSLNTFLRCPLSFYYEQVLRIPTLMSEAASYGLAMHQSLQRLFEQMLAQKPRTFHSENRLLELFEQEMQQLRSYFNAQEYEQRLHMGRRNLQQFYRENLGAWHKKVRIEFAIRNVEVEGVPLTGVIDKLELYPEGKAKVVDYKTGSLSERKLRPPSKSRPHGGSYWRQLVFYKILYENYRTTTHRVTSGTIAYLDPDVHGKLLQRELTFSENDVVFVKNLIRESWERIQQHDFYEGCGESNCVWCNFVKRNQPVDSLANRAVEELDD